MLSYIESKHPHILDEIKNTKAISEELAEKIKAALDDLAQQLGELS